MQRSLLPLIKWISSKSSQGISLSGCQVEGQFNISKLRLITRILERVTSGVMSCHVATTYDKDLNTAAKFPSERTTSVSFYLGSWWRSLEKINNPIYKILSLLSIPPGEKICAWPAFNRSRCCPRWLTIVSRKIFLQKTLEKKGEAWTVDGFF